MGKTAIIKGCSLEDLSKFVFNIDFLDYEAMEKRLSEKKLNRIDYIVIQCILENFITDGEVLKLYEDYHIDELKGRAFEVLCKIKNIKEG